LFTLISINLEFSEIKDVEYSSIFSSFLPNIPFDQRPSFFKIFVSVPQISQSRDISKFSQDLLQLHEVLALNNDTGRETAYLDR